MVNTTYFRNKLSIYLLVLATVLLVIPAQFTYAEPVSPQAVTQQQKDELQKQLDAIEKEIAQYEHELSGVQSEKNTLATKLRILQVQKSKVQAQIHETSLNLEHISEQMGETQKQIVEAQIHIGELRKKIANILPDIYAQDQQSTVEILLASDGLIGFYNELDAFEQINKNLNDLLDKLDEESKQLKVQQDQLDAQQDQQQQFLNIQSLQSQELVSNIGDQSSLLSQTKGVEATYQAQLSTKRKEAAAIRNRIYEIAGGGPKGQVTFGEAVEIAKSVSDLTGVRAAFLLAILTQESSLGKNVGTCNRAGDPPSKSYKVVMKPTRDVKPFLEVTAELGLDPETTPISCPMHDKRGNQVGWGGAMGPAQFIPSTWMGYKNKVTALTGRPANPWDIRDAFAAAAIKLKADGAGTVAGEWAAAMRYFSGGTNPKFRFYGDNVIKTANNYQEDIDAL